MSSTSEPTALESLSQTIQDYTGIQVQGEVMIGISIALLAAILVASYFIPTVREAVEKFLEPLTDTIKEEGSAKMAEKLDEAKEKLSEKIRQL